MHSLRTFMAAFAVAASVGFVHDALAQSFASPKSTTAGGGGPGGASVGDFNQDGRLDLVEANFNAGTISVMLGNGDGTYQAIKRVSSGSGPVSTAVADFNHDGHLDFASTNAYSHSVTVALGKGDGTFDTFAYAAGPNAAALALGDFNNDGITDIAVTNATNAQPKTVEILLGKGPGTFDAAVAYSTGATTSFRIAAADFNSDGNLDLVVTEQATNSVRFLVGLGNGTFVPSAKVYSVPATAAFVSVADFNRDGKPDFAVTSKGSPNIAIFLGQGDFNFARPAAPSTGVEAVSLDIADFNGDGFADLVVDSYKNKVAQLHVFLGNGDGTFQSPTAVAAGSAFVSVVAGDINGDGKADLLTCDGGSRNSISTYLNTTAFPASGNLVNVSTRLRVSGGENVLIGGFIVQGADAKRLIVRGIGPDLQQQGVSDPLQNPTIELVNSQGQRVGFNDNWRSSQEAEIMQTGVAPHDDRDAALIATVPTGTYTAIVRSADASTGVALVEAYDLATGGNSHFVNISTRGFVSTDPNVMIGGFILPDGPPAKVVIRGLGPSLTSHGVSGALQDPTLELRRSTGEVVYSNDNWRTTQPSEVVSSTLAPFGEKDAAIYIKLSPGEYTAVLRGKNNSSGIGLLEVFRLP
jgi:hypothetical protein